MMSAWELSRHRDCSTALADQLEDSSMFGYNRRELGWLAVAAGSAALTGSLVHRAMAGTWRTATDEEPPEARDAGTPWGKALMWAVGTAAIAAAAEVVAQKGAAAGWKHATGRKPPEV